MKKILTLLIALFLITSCGKAIQTPQEILQQHQSSMLESMDTLSQAFSEQSQSQGDISFAINSAEGNLEGSGKYNFQNDQANLASSGNIDMNMGVSSLDSSLGFGETFSASMNLDLVTIKNKFFFKLNSFNIDGGDDNFGLAIISGFTTPFQQQWFFIEDSLGLYADAFNTETLLDNRQSFLDLMQDYPVLEYLSENENKDFHDYQVQLHEANILSILTQINQEHDNTLMSEEEIADIQVMIQDINAEMTGNIKINPKKNSYFTFSFGNEDANIVFENTAKTLALSLNEFDTQTLVSYRADKTFTGLNGVIQVNEAGTEILSGTLDLKVGKETSSMDMSLTSIDEFSGEEVSIDFQMNDTTTEAEVDVVAPEGAESIEEAMVGLGL